MPIFSSPVKPRMSIALWKYVITGLMSVSVHVCRDGKENIANVTHIRGHQFFSVIDTGHADLPLADKWVVEGVGGDQESLWMGNNNVKSKPYNKQDICSNCNPVLQCYLSAQASCWTWSGRKYGNSFLQTAEMLLWIFPANLTKETRLTLTKDS